MAKYDEKLKLRIVRLYMSGRCTRTELSHRYKLDKSMIGRWLASYRRHGVFGVRKKYTFHSARFKLSVLKRMWAKGLSRSETESFFDLRQNGVVARWERQYHAGGLEGLEPKPRGHRKKKMPEPPRAPKPSSSQSEGSRSREQLLEEVEYLRAEVAYLKKLNALVQAKGSAVQKKRS